MTQVIPRCHLAQACFKASNCHVLSCQMLPGTTSIGCQWMHIHANMEARLMFVHPNTVCCVHRPHKSKICSWQMPFIFQIGILHLWIVRLTKYLFGKILCQACCICVVGSQFPQVAMLMEIFSCLVGAETQHMSTTNGSSMHAVGRRWSAQRAQRTKQQLDP